MGDHVDLKMSRPVFYATLKPETMNGGPFALTLMRFRGIRSFERTEQNFRHIRNFFLKKTKTSRDRPKSTPYPKLKNSKKTSKCQVLFYSTQKSKFFEKNFFEKITYSKKWTEWRAGAR